MTPEIRIALAGLGTVGRAVVRLLREAKARYQEELGVAVQVGAILDRSYTRKDLSSIGAEVRWTDSLEDFLAEPCDIVVELIGGADPADRIITASLERQKAVVTANKLLMALHGERYLALARQQNTYLGFEACVAGGIPIIRVLQRCLFSDRIVRLRAILNGTCNFVLTEMAESGRSFHEVLKQAQALGYAEADPTLDVSGQDSRDKLAILSALSFGRWAAVETIPAQGITEIAPIDLIYARQLNCTIKLLGVGEEQDGGISLRVSPFLVDNGLPLSKISGVYNAVEVTGAMVGSTVFSGRGAGGDPTAVSVVADILNAALAVAHKSPATLQASAPCRQLSTGGHSAPSRETYPFYLRFFVKDQPGIIAALSGILAREEINIDSVIQEKWSDPSNLPFIITVEPTPFATLQKAVQEMSRPAFNNIPPLALPILRYHL